MLNYIITRLVTVAAGWWQEIVTLYYLARKNYTHLTSQPLRSCVVPSSTPTLLSLLTNRLLFINNTHYSIL